MNINELAQNILKQEDERLSKAFTMCISGLLISNGIQPILNKTCEEWSENDDLNKYIMRREYQVSFDIDTTEHDAKIMAEALEPIKAIIQESDKMMWNSDKTLEKIKKLLNEWEIKNVKRD